MGLKYREISYIATENDEGASVRSVMSGRLMMSSREITRCKQFEDGVMILREGGYENRKVALKYPYKRNDPEDGYFPTMLKDILQTGDVLRIRIYEDGESAGDVVPWDSPIDIVYEDEDIILLNKPGDMVVHPSYAHYKDSLSNALKGYYVKTGQDHVIRTIGRLDRETSGLILFAKNRYAAALMSEQGKNMSRRKEYLAIVAGVFDVPYGTVDAPIKESDGSRMIREVRPDGKDAVTHYVVEKQFEDYALVRLKLDTGRTHQIRVHMAYLGHPLLGDNFYGKQIPDNHGMKRAALHAAHLEFTHPVNKEKMSFDVEVPEDMAALI